MGIRSFAFVNSEDLECRFYTARVSTFGLGRAIRKDVLQKFETFWPEKSNSGLDNASHFQMARSGIFDVRVSSDSPLALDIKSQVNIWKFNYLEGSKIDFERAVEGLSDQEIEAIKALSNVQV